MKGIKVLMQWFRWVLLVKICHTHFLWSLPPILYLFTLVSLKTPFVRLIRKGEMKSSSLFSIQIRPCLEFLTSEIWKQLTIVQHSNLRGPASFCFHLKILEFIISKWPDKQYCILVFFFCQSAIIYFSFLCYEVQVKKSPI